MRAAWHRFGSLSLIAAGPVGFALWDWVRPEFVNGMEALVCALSAMMFGSFWLLFARAFARLEARRPPHRFCHGCGFDLTGRFSPACPQCGTPVREQRDQRGV